MKGPGNSRQVLALCDEALEKDKDQRREFLDNRCAGDMELRRAVDSVLIAVAESEEFLRPHSDTDKQSRIGQDVGGYVVIEHLAEGGMGTVFLAERRNDDFVQKVAIKFVHRQFLAKETLRRFNAERKMLAALQHPYIAQLIDGGTTTDSVPYLVMEYVEGQPIDEYCDNNRLTVNDRLKLVQNISLAVQAAHRNLIVHRDLKPSNVLITADGIPKLLDFGIAKLMDPASDSAGNTTVFGHQAMTPDYASPEQILEGHVTTVSDVYSLGVMTYQLLTGSRPYNIASSNLRDMLRFFESHSVTAPNRFLEALDPGTIKRVADMRGSKPDKLIRSLGGDLGQVVAKTLQPDPARRYESVRDFSDDIERYLDGMPVTARSDTVGYRMSKFVARNKIGVGATVIAILAILAGLGTSLWQANVARDQLQRAEAVSRYLGDILLSPSANWDAAIQTGADATIADVLEAAEAQLDSDLEEYPEVRIELYHKIGEARTRMEDHDAAIRVQGKALKIAESALPSPSPLYATAVYRMATALGGADQQIEAIDFYERALRAADEASLELTIEKLYMLNDAAVTYKLTGNYAHALELQQRAVNGTYELFGEGLLPLHTNGYSNLALFQFELGKISDAESSLALGLTAYEMYPQNTRFVGGVMHMAMGRLRSAQLDDQGAARHFQNAVDDYTLAFDSRHEEVAFATAQLARVQVRLGNTDRAAELVSDLDSFDSEVFTDPEIWMYYLARASVSLARGDANAAIESANLALAPESVDVMWNLDKIESRLVLAQALAAAGDLDSARQEFEVAQDIVKSWIGPDSDYARHVAALRP